MKTLYQLEQEAKEARDNAIFLHGSESPLSQDIVDSFINAAVAMVTYQFALGMEDADQIWNESGTKVISEKLPELLQAQKELDSDGWIDWGGGDCPVDPELYVFVEFRNSSVPDAAYKAGSYEWRRDIVKRDWDIVAYRIAK